MQGGLPTWESRHHPAVERRIGEGGGESGQGGKLGALLVDKGQISRTDACAGASATQRQSNECEPEIETQGVRTESVERDIARSVG
jgi:hypothetical protein